MPAASLRIYLLGGIAAECDGAALSPPRLKKSHWLLALLALRLGREVSREWLAETLWPDSDPSRALANLRHTLANDLRPALGAATSALRVPTQATLCLDASHVWVDVAAFDAALARGDSAAREHAVALYRGPLLEGCLEEWVLGERVAREEAFFGALEALATEALNSGQPGTAVGFLRRLITASPLRESAHAALLEALAACGDAASMRQAYRELRLLLRRELNTEPSASTRALFERLEGYAKQPGVPATPAPVTRRQLPVPLTRLIGRSGDIAEVRGRFERGRLVTLTGTGGVGKTRLSLAVAEALAGEFSDGVWFVALAGLAEPELVPGAVAQALQLKEPSGQSLTEVLTAELASRSLLLVLDNCEHVLDACAELTQTLLEQCPQVRILATSREGLGLFGEWVYRVPSLTPPPLALLDIDKDPVARLSEYAASALFVERATAQSYSLRLTEQDAVEIAEICARLDGIPLAIEMAAARVRTMSLSAIRAGLSDRFALLQSGSRTALPRHQTLRALIDWSYALLSDSERALLRRLSVFAGGWTEEAAAQVCATAGSLGISAGLFSLVDKSLVLFEGGNAKPRYRLLEMVRQYGTERLTESGESDTVNERHRECFLALAEQAAPELTGPDSVEWLRRLEEEHDNLRAALAWSLSEKENSGALRLCGALARFWSVRGHLEEGRKWCEQALKKPGTESQSPARASALHGAGMLAWDQGDYAAAKICYAESLTLSRATTDQKGMAAALNGLGLVARALGDYEAARDYLTESLVLKRALDDARGIAGALNNLGLVARSLGEYAAARAYHEESLSFMQAQGDHSGIADSLNNLGIVAQVQGDFVAARRYLEESLALYRKLGDRPYMAYSLGNLGEVASAQGDYEAARPYLEECLSLLVEVGGRSGIVYCLEALALLDDKEHRPERAVSLWSATEALREAQGFPLSPQERERYTQNLATARQAIGESVFQSAWKRGHALTLEQAIALAKHGPETTASPL